MRIPILCYHSVAETVAPELAEFTVLPRSLAAQMALLRRLGYRSITLRELVVAFDSGATLGKAVVLTFDDGYRDTVSVAAPILAAHGYCATIFVVSELVGSRPQTFAGTPTASWDDLQALTQRGWEIGLHTATHPDLTTVSETQLHHELVDAQRMLQTMLNTPVATVAYPWGRYNDTVVDMTRRSGAIAAVTVTHTLASSRSPRYALPRCAVRRSDSLFDFRMTLRCGWNVGSLARLVRRRRGRGADARSRIAVSG